MAVSQSEEAIINRILENQPLLEQPGMTRSRFYQTIARSFSTPMPSPPRVQTIAEKMEAAGKIRLPAKTQCGGPRPRTGKRKKQVPRQPFLRPVHSSRFRRGKR